MRLLVVMASLSPWSQSLAMSLAALGHEVHSVDVENGPGGGIGSEKIDGFREDASRFRDQMAGVHRLASHMRGPLRYVWAAPQFRRLARQLQADMVLTLYGGGFALMAYLSGFRPYCVYVVGSDVLLAPAAARQVNRRTLQSASRVFANGRHLSDRTRALVPACSVIELLLGVDLSKLARAQFSRRPVQIICTRGFEAVYNSSAIVKALAILPAGLADYRVVFTSVGERLAEARALASRVLPPAIRDRIQFSEGGTHAAVLAALSASHVFVSMSRSDGTATSLLEALGTGLYPILSDIPQNREWVEPSDGNGRLVPLDDTPALAGALADCIRHVDRIAAFSDGNRRQVAERADAQRNRFALSAALEGALAGYHSRRG